MKKEIKHAGILLLAAAALCAVSWQENEREEKIREYTAFFSVPGAVRDEENVIENEIAKLTGAKCREIWLTGQTADEATGSYIASGEYPDFMIGNAMLYEAEALVPIDAYWEDYPNIRNYMADEEWDKLRQPDGHIYWMPQFGVVQGEAPELVHEGDAFWIQTRVL